jgi:hypothetical protein
VAVLVGLGLDVAVALAVGDSLMTVAVPSVSAEDVTV